MYRRRFRGLLLAVLTLLSYELVGGAFPMALAPRAAATENADRQAVVDVLGRYEKAMEEQDLAALKEIWPRIRKVKSEARTISMSFELTRSLELDLEVSSVEIAGGEATVECVRRDEITLVNGEIFENESLVRFRLRLAGGAWRIVKLEDFEGEEMR